MTLSNALVGYEPVLDTNRSINATRVSVVAANPARPLSAASAYAEMSGQWPDDAGTLIIDVHGSEGEDELEALTPKPNCWLGLPSKISDDPQAIARIIKLSEAGFKLTLTGKLISRLPDDLAKSLEMAIVPQGSSTEKPFGCDGINSIAQAKAAFETGAKAVIGWPINDIKTSGNQSANNPSFEVIGRLLALVNANADPAELEPVFKQDPSLSFRLLRYLNSAAFGLRVEVQSIQHAVMMIGMQRLKKWLALLLATAARDPDLKPLMFASLRRGFMLEALVGDVLGDQSKDEAFILGVFSLLDKLFNESFESLFSRLQIPEGVHDALVSNTGQYMPYLKLAKALEGVPGTATDDALTDAFIERADCNTALMKALGDASQTENQK